MPNPRLSNQLRKVSETEKESILATIGSYLVDRKFLPHTQTPGFYVYEKVTPVNGALAILLLLCFLVPGIVYLLIGPSKQVVSLQFIPNERGVMLDIKAPSVYMEQMILKQIQPYLEAS
jgi:hypothetical protein